MNQSERNLRRLFSRPTCTMRSAEIVSEKAPKIVEANRFSRRGGTCRLHAIFMNQLRINWAYQEKLSSASVFLRTVGNFPINSSSSHGRRQNRTAASIAAFVHSAATRSGKARIAEEIAAAEKINASYVGRVLRLTLLAPEVVEAILDGHQRAGLTLAVLMQPFALGWRQQQIAIDLTPGTPKSD